MQLVPESANKQRKGNKTYSERRSGQKHPTKPIQRPQSRAILNCRIIIVMNGRLFCCRHKLHLSILLSCLSVFPADQSEIALCGSKRSCSVVCLLCVRPSRIFMPPHKTFFLSLLPGSIRVYVSRSLVHLADRGTRSVAFLALTEFRGRPPTRRGADVRFAPRKVIFATKPVLFN